MRAGHEQSPVDGDVERIVAESGTGGFVADVTMEVEEQGQGRQILVEWLLRLRGVEHFLAVVDRRCRIVAYHRRGDGLAPQLAQSGHGVSGPIETVCHEGHV